MQETEITKDLSMGELMLSGYCLELDNNSEKSRVGFYIAKDITNITRSDPEGINLNIIIIDLVGESKLRVINVHRSFSPQAGESQQIKFKYQLSIIRKAITDKFGSWPVPV